MEGRITYSRDEMTQVRASNPSLDESTIASKETFAEIELAPVYSSDDMRRIEKLEGLHWPSGGKVVAAAYWIFNNYSRMNYQFGIFPAYLPFFDEEVFRDAARDRSPIIHHLDKPFMIEMEYTHPEIVSYELANGEIQQLSLEEAMVVYRAGYFTSQMKCAITRRALIERPLWFTLSDLIVRNGKAMPFVLDNTAWVRYELQYLKEELNKQASRREEIKADLLSLEARRRHVQEEMAAITERMSQPDADEEVDPLKLVRTSPGIDGARACDIVTAVGWIKPLYNMCDKKKLNRRNKHLFTDAARCGVCGSDWLRNASHFIAHFVGAKHQKKRNRSVATAYDPFDKAAFAFWSEELEECAKDRASSLLAVSAAPPAAVNNVANAAAKPPVQRSFVRRYYDKPSFRMSYHSSESNYRILEILVAVTIVASIICRLVGCYNPIIKCLLMMPGLLALTSKANVMRLSYAGEDALHYMAGTYLRFMGELDPVEEQGSAALDTILLDMPRSSIKYRRVRLILCSE